VHQDNPVTERLNQIEGPSFYTKAVALAEKLGYHSFWATDHLTLEKNKGPIECWSTLAAVATATNSIRLGSLVTPVIAYPPLVLAKRVSAVQVISRDRVLFGVGAGWYPDEFQAYGLRFEGHKVRMEMLEEALHLLKLVWSSEEPVTYNGKYYSVKGALLRPSAAFPPLWLGGTGDKLLNLVSRYGSGWIPFEIPPHEIVKRRNRLNSILDQLGRDINEIKVALASRILAAKTEKEAEDVAHRLKLRRDYEAPDLPKPLRAHLIMGSYEHCANELADYVDSGVCHLVISPQPADMTIESLSILKDEVISRV